MPKVKEKPNDNPRAQVASVGKALYLLQLFTVAHNSELTINEISDITSWNRTTIYRFLQSLCENGYVEYISDRQSYKLTFKLVNLANCMLQNLNLQSIASPYMNQLINKWKLNANLAVPDGSQIMVIHNAKSDFSLPPVYNGHRGGLHSCGTGKAIMSTWPTDYLEKFLDENPLTSYTTRTITNKIAFMSEIQETRIRGYAVDRGEYIYSNYCIAAPIYDSSKNGIGAISLYGPEEIIFSEKTDAIAADVISAAKSISAALGYAG